VGAQLIDAADRCADGYLCWVGTQPFQAFRSASARRQRNCTQKVPLADVDAAMPQDCVSRGAVEMTDCPSKPLSGSGGSFWPCGPETSDVCEGPARSPGTQPLASMSEQASPIFEAVPLRLCASRHLVICTKYRPKCIDAAMLARCHAIAEARWERVGRRPGAVALVLSKIAEPSGSHPRARPDGLRALGRNPIKSGHWRSMD